MKDFSYNENAKWQKNNYYSKKMFSQGPDAINSERGNRFNLLNNQLATF